MLYQNLNEIFNSLLNAVIFGFLSNVLVLVISVFLDFSASIILIPKYISRISGSPKNVKECFSFYYTNNARKSYVVEFIKDFLSVVLIGILYSIFNYAASDGIFRVYILITAIMSFFAFEKYILPYFEFFVRKVISFIYGTVVWSFSVVAIPISKFFLFISKKTFKRITKFTQNSQNDIKNKKESGKICKLTKKIG